MKSFFAIVFFLVSIVSFGQAEEELNLRLAIKELHEAMVKKNSIGIDRLTDKELSYGHSNGWVESKAEFIKNMESGYMTYHSIREDSMRLGFTNLAAHVRFTAEIEATLNEKKSVFKLKVLELWVRKGKDWILFARQAVKDTTTEVKQ